VIHISYTKLYGIKLSIQLMKNMKMVEQDHRDNCINTFLEYLYLSCQYNFLLSSIEIHNLNTFQNEYQYLLSVLEYF